MAGLAQVAYGAYQHRDAIKKVFTLIAIVFASIGFFLYLIVATVVAVVQGTGGVTDGVTHDLPGFTEFQQFTYKTIYGETWYVFVHPYFFPTLGALTQGVLIDTTPRVGRKHVAWDIADRIPRQTEIRAFADGTVIDVKNNILFSTTRRWQFCDSEGGICWYEVTQPADVQIGCGYEVIIQHADSLRTQYCHLISTPFVHIGDPVLAGQTIGYQGSTGWSTGKHLHFALWRDWQQIDPSYAFSQTSLGDWSEPSP